MHVNLLFDGLSHDELLTFKTGPPCIGNPFSCYLLIVLDNIFKNVF